MKLTDIFKLPKKQQSKKYEGTDYDYSTPEKRVNTVQALYNHSKDERSPYEALWRKYNNYYNFIHDVTKEVKNAVEDAGIPWDPTVIPDPYIQIESQVDPIVPTPEFTGRDDDTDNKKAKQREYVVKYVLENNQMERMNNSNERRLLKYGDAFWKAYWDETMGKYGDIRIKDIPIESVFIDPAAKDGDFDAAWYVNYTYPLHKMHFRIIFSAAIKKLGITLEQFIDSEYNTDAEMFTETDIDPDVVMVLEHWFRQPDAGSLKKDGRTIRWEAGDVACVMIAGNKELTYIPKYWENTNCKKYPFVHTWRIHDENSFYNKSELFALIPMVDAADRELAFAELNDALMGNDVILTEEGALAEGEEITNTPGKVVKLNQNRMGGVQRLGGLNTGGNKIPMIQWYQEQMARASRNYDTNMGRETTKIQTASGLAQIRQDASEQADIKKSDRLNGYKELFELIDWLCLEFFDDNRMIYIGAKNEKEKKQNLGPFMFNATNFMELTPIQDENGETMTDESGTPIYEKYIPRVDVTVNAGDGVVKSKGATLSTLDKLSQTNVTPLNYKILSAELEIMDIPQKTEIIDMWDKMFTPKINPQVTEVLENDPEFLEQVTQLAAAKKAQSDMQKNMDAKMQSIQGVQNGQL